MGKKDVNKPKGRMSAYAFFIQTCREEHKKKHPGESVNFSEFSKKCSEKWKVRRQTRYSYSFDWYNLKSLSYIVQFAIMVLFAVRL